MAYVSQDLKQKLTPSIKAVLAKYKLKGSIAVNNHSTLVVKIKQGPLDFIGNMMEVASNSPDHSRRTSAPTNIQVNTYWIDSNYTGVPRACLLELNEAMQGPDWYDKSDIQTDYFCESHYININVGQWDKPYILTKD